VGLVDDDDRQEDAPGAHGGLHRGDRRSPETTFFGRKLKEVLDAAGIKRDLSPHGLRRSFAVLLQDAGAPDSVIGQALGHKQTGVTRFNYLPRRDDNLQRWVERIPLDASLVKATPKPSSNDTIEVVGPSEAATATNPPPAKHCWGQPN
jgi:hypothetical protein